MFTGPPFPGRSQTLISVSSAPQNYQKLPTWNFGLLPCAVTESGKGTEAKARRIFKASQVSSFCHLNPMRLLKLCEVSQSPGGDAPPGQSILSLFPARRIDKGPQGAVAVGPQLPLHFSPPWNHIL